MRLPKSTPTLSKAPATDGPAFLGLMTQLCRSSISWSVLGRDRLGAFLETLHKEDGYDENQLGRHKTFLFVPLIPALQVLCCTYGKGRGRC